MSEATITVMSGATSPTFRFDMANTPCEMVPLYCMGNRYWGRDDWTCEDNHITGYSCVADHECENGMVMIPDWGGPCPPNARTANGGEK